jgi:uncharacterized protein (TIGR02453 family)
MPEAFSGFPTEAFEFFKQLAANNKREWFLEHKEEYEQECRAPLQALVTKLEPKYGPTKISRINRDLRFSRDKKPYKTYIAAGVGGHYISLSATGVYVGAGLYKPDGELLQRFRESIDDKTTGPRLARILKTLSDKGYEVHSYDRLTSAPRGFAADHPRIELLKMKGVVGGQMFPPAAWLSTARAAARIERVMADTRPLVDWLHRYVGVDPWEARKKKA